MKRNEQIYNKNKQNKQRLNCQPFLLHETIPPSPLSLLFLENIVIHLNRKNQHHPNLLNIITTAQRSPTESLVN